MAKGTGNMTRLLFVDDEPFVLDALRRLLGRRRPDWDLAFAASGSEALAEIKEKRVDVIVADMRMPGMDGAELLGKVRELDSGVVRIILSGQSDRGAVLRAVKVAHQFLAKPFDPLELESTLDRTCRLKELLSDPALQDLVGGVQSLPSAPRVYSMLVEQLSRPETSLGQVVEVLKQDPAMCAKVLQMVRSAFFGTRLETVRIEDAVARLGFNVIKSVALTAGVFEAFKQAEPIPGFSVGAEQQHALLVARAAQLIVAGGPLADDAFMAGMLHDVGKLILAARNPKVLRRLLEEAAAEHRMLSEVEQRKLHASHAEIGAYLLGIWGLPSTVVEAVANHHVPSRMADPTLDAVAAVHIADGLVREVDSGLAVAVHEGAARLDHDYLATMGVTERLSDWRESIRDLVGGDD
jgi:HD-like signal output (HDOD) protein/ActR/RegA family two-component response regulator